MDATCEACFFVVFLGLSACSTFNVGLPFSSTVSSIKFPDPTKDDKRCAVVRDVKIDGMVIFDVSPRAYIWIRGPPLVSSPTISAMAPLRCAHLTFSRKPH